MRRGGDLPHAPPPQKRGTACDHRSSVQLQPVFMWKRSQRELVRRRTEIQALLGFAELFLEFSPAALEILTIPLLQGFGRRASGRQLVGAFQGRKDGEVEGRQRHTKGGDLLQQEPGLQRGQLGNPPLTIAVDNQVEVGRRTSEFTAGQVVGCVVFKDHLLAGIVRWPRRMGVPGPDQGCEDSTGDSSTVTDPRFPESLERCGGMPS